MMQLILGGQDPALAFAFVALTGGICVIVTAMIVKRRTTLEINNEFEIEKMRVEASDKKDTRDSSIRRDLELGKLAMQREIEFKRIDSGMVDAQLVRDNQDRG